MNFTVRSQNFHWHTPEHAETYAEALAIAKRRGFEALIRLHDAKLVASWSPLYGTRVYDRELAGLQPALQPIAINGRPV